MNTQATTDPEIGKSVQAAGLATNYLEQGSGDPVSYTHLTLPTIYSV